jgi:hypothetical protein
MKYLVFQGSRRFWGKAQNRLPNESGAERMNALLGRQAALTAA